MFAKLQVRMLYVGRLPNGTLAEVRHMRDGVRGVGVNTDKIAGQRLSIWRGGPCDNRGLVNVLEEQYGITRWLRVAGAPTTARKPDSQG